MINLVFLLDITGSMGSELEGVKSTVGALVRTVFADEYEVMVTLITFTENRNGCYVTTDSFTNGEYAQQFVAAINLCVPPGMKHVNANGGDGDENHKAAFVELLALDNSMPTIAFMITDAGPHLIADRATPESLHEVKHLAAKQITDIDTFSLLDQVENHFDGKLILNVIKYTTNSDHRLYGAIAKKFNGVLITPKERRSSVLAAGLMTILTKMFDSCLGVVANEVETEADAASWRTLHAFEFYDIADFVVPTCERELPASNRIPTVAASSKDVLFEFLERATVVVGTKFSKRAIVATGLWEQVELLVVIAKCMTKSVAMNEAMDRAKLLIETIQNGMPAENKGHFKIQLDTLPHLLSQQLKATPAMDTAVSAITLMSTEETLIDSLGDGEEVDPNSILQVITGLFLGHLANLQLPVKNGKVDFMDSWAAVINDISNDVMSASDFLSMIGRDDTISGLQTRAKDYNYVQICVDPNDAVGSELLRIASGTQVLDIITGMIAGAPPGQFSPNMFRGTMSASLMALLSPQRDNEPLREFQWDIVAKLVHSLRVLMGVHRDQMEVDPEAALSKLLYRLLRLKSCKDHSEEEELLRQALRMFLKEMFAGQIQKFAKYNPNKYWDIIESVVGYTHNEGITAEEDYDVFAPHPLDNNVWVFDGTRATLAVLETKLFQSFESSANAVIRAVTMDCSAIGKGMENAPPQWKLNDVWPAITKVAAKYLLLQKRTARYECVKTKTGITWQPNSVVQQDLSTSRYQQLAMDALKHKHAEFLKQRRLMQGDATKAIEWQAALKAVRGSFDEFVAWLQVVKTDTVRGHKLLLKALKMHSLSLEKADFEAKVIALVTGRVLAARGQADRIVFNRGNLHPHPDKFLTLSIPFQKKLKSLQVTRGWSVSHHYRESDTPNHSGHSNTTPSAWAARRSLKESTFWED